MRTEIPEGRLPGIDVARTWMMLLGIVVHGTAFSLDAIRSHYWLGTVALVSSTFRMEAFFAISGLLAAKILHKKSAADWLGGRASALLIPFFFGVLVVNPAGSILSNLLGGRLPLDHVRLDISYLWFLMTLFCCCAVVAGWQNLRGSGWASRGNRLMDAMVQMNTGLLYAIAVLLGTVAILFYDLGMALSPELMVVHRLLARFVHDLLFTVGQVPYYLPFFLFGFALVRAPDFCRSAFANRNIKIAVVLTGAATLTAMQLTYGSALYAVHEPWASPIPVLLALVKAFVAPLACVLIIMAALRVRLVPLWVQALSRASYTMYILHVPVVFVTLQALLSLGVTGLCIPLIVVPASLLATFAFHQWVVEGSAILQLLLNGKMPPDRAFFRRATPGLHRGQRSLRSLRA